MGTSQSVSVFTEELLDEYTVLTFLTRGEILTLYKAFSSLGLDEIDSLNKRYPIEDIQECFPQLKCNPFRDRIFRVFSSTKDGKFSFEDMLDLYSVMSYKCPDKVKAVWAFRIFDYDEDGALDEKDLMIVIDKLTQSEKTGNEIAIENKKHIIKLLEEFDLESNGAISPLEFQHAVAISMMTGCLTYPLGWSGVNVQRICADSGIFNLGKCELRWGYLLAVIACLDAFILCILAFTLATRHLLLSSDSGSLYEGGVNTAYMGDTISMTGSRKSLNLFPLFSINPEGQEDFYAQMRPRSIHTNNSTQGHLPYSAHNFEI
ncbi:calcium and integrin-binding protein 1 isoform X2 [Harmonia axyridis]|uniref:calcium and integrin-binding protein 1 isoform X2 n=1 Tax=Harmonia axyridis TaxID=115357 RepID=UPI001E2792C8|nr:calcium and integrin-binding protein 1 isoform X2 [Harmonia axyridis]